LAPGAQPKSFSFVTICPDMKAFLQHPATLVTFAFVLLASAWAVIVTTAVKHRAESVPIQVEAVDHSK